jgi:pyruvate/2-oxoacid:ferredoxin oxidoreductase alpha subunit
MKDAVIQARKAGKKVSSLIVYSMFPVPEEQIKQAAAGVKRVIVAEENISGQYRMLIEPLLNGKEVIGVNKIGAMITPGEIKERIM